MDPIKIRRFFKTWNETIGFFISFVLFILSPLFIRMFDPYAGTFDFGVVQTAIISLLLFQWSGIAAWFTFRFNFPTLHQWFDDVMESDITDKATDIVHLRTMRNAWFAMTIYFGYFILMVAINFAFISMDVTW